MRNPDEQFSFKNLCEARKKRVLIMGILNVTSDSFFDGGKYLSKEKAIERAYKIVEEGADILDIGGESTRPGSTGVSADEEKKRVIPVVEEVSKKIPIPISIDTTKSDVAEEALDAGARIINDISALRFSPDMGETAKRFNAGVVLMHMQGTPRDMQNEPHYRDVVSQIKDFLFMAIKRAESSGIDKEAIAIDPGIGFGKTLKHNIEILRHLDEFKKLGKKILIGVSRKSFIGHILNAPPEERLEGSIAANLWAIFNGAEIIRTHDVLSMERARKIFEEIAG
jgi:dihydropteroate synthase